MSVSLKNKISQYETAPPSGVWDRLSLQLDQEFSARDSLLSTRLENTFTEVPVAAWDNIAAALGHNEEKKRTPARIIPLVYKRMAVAAVLLGVISMITIYLINDDNTDKNNTIVKSSVETISPEPSVDMNTIRPSPKTLIASLKASNRAARASVRKPLANYISNKLFNSESEIDIADPRPVANVMAMEPVEVSAPPIRDRNGNIIMDYAVIKNPNDPYITVTSPNGNQTKISHKFLTCLKYLNGNFPSSEVNYEEQQWKSRFQEWRNKISTATIVPDENNFFDIFELQELIRD